MMKNKTINFLLVISGALLGLFISEIGLRAYSHFTNFNFREARNDLKNPNRLPNKMWDKKYGIPALNPNAKVMAKTYDFEVEYKINSHGHRDREYPFKRDHNKIRILALGDSFTFGEGVPYGGRFVDIIEERLPDSEVITMAVPGNGIEHELIAFAFDGIKYSPDLLLLFINRSDTRRWIKGFAETGKIFLHKNVENGHSTESKDTVYASAVVTDQSENLDWYEHLSTFQFIMHRFDIWRLWKQSLDNWEGMTSELYNDSDAPVEENDLLVRERTILVLRKYLEITKMRKIKFVIVNIDPNWDLSYIKKAIPELNYFDLSLELSQHAKTASLRFKYDQHFNPQTHHFIGKKTMEILNTVFDFSKIQAK